MNLDKITKEDLLEVIRVLIYSNIDKYNTDGPSLSFGIRDIKLVNFNPNSSVIDIENAFIEEIFDICFPGWNKELIK